MCDSCNEWDAKQMADSDMEKLVGTTIEAATYGRLAGFDYEAVTLKLSDGRVFQFAPWDYEGFSAGLEKRWTEPNDGSAHELAGYAVDPKSRASGGFMEVPNAPDGWQGTEPAEGTRRALIRDVIREAHGVCPGPGGPNAASLRMADAVESALLRQEGEDAP